MLPVAYIMLDAALKSTVLLSAAWVAGRLMKNHSAASRHLMRALALAGCLLLPLFSMLLPAWHVPGLPQYGSFGFSAYGPQNEGRDCLPCGHQRAVTEHDTEHKVTRSLIPTPPVQDAADSEPDQRNSSTGRGDAHAIQQAGDRNTIPEKHASANAPVTTSRTFDLRGFLGFGWLLGATVFLIRLVLAEIRLRRLLHNATPVRDQLWKSRLLAVARAVGIRRKVALLASQETEIPLTTGALHPAVVLSPDFEEWPALRSDAVLRHEMAHIKRMDAITHALANLASAIYWFHPLVWKTAITMRAEGERACDDCVLAGGARASEYAHALLEMAVSLRQPDFTAALAMARRSELEGRVMAILNPKQQRGSVSRNAFLAIIILTLAVTLPLAAMHPQTTSDSAAVKPQKPSPAMPAIPATPPAPTLPPAAAIPPAAPTPAIPALPAKGTIPAKPPQPGRPAVAPEPAIPAAPAEPEEIEAEVERAEAAVAAADAAMRKADANLGDTDTRIEQTDEQIKSEDSSEQVAQYRKQIDELKADIATLNAEILALRSQHLPALAAQQREALKALQGQAATMSQQSAELKALQEKFSGDSEEMKALRAETAALAASAPAIKAMKARLSAQALANAKASPVLAARIRANNVLLAQSTAGNECLSARGSTDSIQLNSDNGHKRWNMSWSSKECTASVHAEGNFVFSEEGTEIKSISSGGLIEIKERKGDTTRHLKVTPSSAGLNYVFTVNGKQQAFDDDAKKWLASYLLAFDDGWQKF